MNTMIATTRRLTNRQRGMSLVEVLVTLVLISVGLLGVAALQLNTLRGNKEAFLRSQASILTDDILDRMRSNQFGFTTGQYDVNYDGTGQANTPSGADLTAWQAEIDRALPGGANVASGRIARDAPNSSVVTVTIRWSERTDAATLAQTGQRFETPTFSVRTEL